MAGRPLRPDEEVGFARVHIAFPLPPACMPCLTFPLFLTCAGRLGR
jgi:hypothetical protein